MIVPAKTRLMHTHLRSQNEGVVTPPNPARRLWCSRLLLAWPASLTAAAAWAPLGAHACEVQARHLRITHPWTRATAPAATNAVLSMKFDEVDRDERLIGVSTPVARGARIAGAAAGEALAFDIPAGQETHLAEDRAHVLLTDLVQPLEMGRSYPLQLVFLASGVVDATLTVDFGRFR